MSEWVDLQLSHQMAPVKAPDQLWERVQGQRQRPARRRRLIPRLVLATAAAVVAVIAVAYSATGPREIPRTASFNSGSCNACHTM
jgi:hypothetical protein